MPVSIRAIILCLLALAFPVARAYATPSIQFNPTSITVANGNTFQVSIAINVDSNQVKGGDVVVQYNAADLSAVSFSNGGFFPSLAGSLGASGRVELHGYMSQSDNKTGSGTFATITFKAKKDTGSSQLSFVCADTDILTVSLANILSCPQQVNTSAVTFSSGSSNTPTPTPVPGGGTNSAPYCTSLTSDRTDGTGNPLAVAFTCAGVDPGGLILAAEFVFGDGTSQLVEKNVGSPGSITTSHTYTTIGSMGASCRVRDNDRVYSPSADACKRIITIRPKTSGGGTNTTVTPTPTQAIISIIDETPEPTPQDSPPAYPEEEVLVESESGGSRFWWIVGGAASLIAAFILLRRRPPTGGPPIPKANPPIPTAPPTPPAPPPAPPTPPEPPQHPV